MAFVLPFVLLDAGMQAIDSAMKLLSGKAFVWLLLLGLFFLCFPISTLFDAVAANMYLRGKENDIKPSLSQIWIVSKYPGIAGTSWRLVSRYIGWALVLIVITVFPYFLFALIVAIAHPSSHHAHQATPHHVHHLWVRVWLIVYAAILSRYTFVMPMVAKERRGGDDVFKKAIVARKAHRWGLYALAIALTVISLFPNWMLTAATDRSLISHKVELLWKTVNLVFVALISAYYCVFKTILMMQASADSSDCARA